MKNKTFIFISVINSLLILSFTLCISADVSEASNIESGSSSQSHSSSALTLSPDCNIHVLAKKGSNSRGSGSINTGASDWISSLFVVGVILCDIDSDRETTTI
jgi:hypothetical protein